MHGSLPHAHLPLLLGVHVAPAGLAVTTDGAGTCGIWALWGGGGGESPRACDDSTLHFRWSVLCCLCFGLDACPSCNLCDGDMCWRSKSEHSTWCHHIDCCA